MRALPWVFVSFCGVVIGLTLTFLVMRALMAIGGSCASGGPYVSARQCPDVTDAGRHRRRGTATAMLTRPRRAIDTGSRRA